MNSSMSNKGSKLTDTFRQSRQGDAARGPATRQKPVGSPAAAAPPPAAAAVAAPDTALQEQQAQADEATLRQFDLDSRFGPCTGITRLQRWERAQKLGLSPPEQVRELVERHGADSEFNKDLFAMGKI